MAGYQNQRGNILFLILIAVALFAALSYAITSSSRAGEGGLSKDKLKLAASQVTQYFAQIESAVSRLKTIQRCSDSQLSFENTIFKRNNGTDFQPDGHNGSAPTDNRCDIFNAAGGAVVMKALPTEVVYGAAPTGATDLQSGAMALVTPTIAQVGSSAPDLAILIAHINPDLCAIINEKNGLPHPDDMATDIPDGNVYAGNFNGTFTTGYNVGETATQLAGKRTFCVETSANDYQMFHVVAAR